MTTIEEHCEEPYCREWGKLGAAGAARGSRLHWQAGVRARARPARARARPVSTTSSRRSATRPCSGSLLPGELAARHPAATRPCSGSLLPGELAASHPAEPGRPPQLCRLVRPAQQLQQQGSFPSSPPPLVPAKVSAMRFTHPQGRAERMAERQPSAKRMR